jgi:hypothetical protein
MATELKRMRQLIGPPAEWAANDIVIGDGELALERGPGGVVLTKVGDGVRRYSELAFGPGQRVLNVLEFGALGDGTGRTPADDSIDIRTEPWNTWNGTPFLEDPGYSPWFANAQNTFQPPLGRELYPFLNTDTWDYIGISRALWSKPTHGGLQSTHIPAGRYVINLSGPGKTLFLNGLHIMKGQEQCIFGDGPYATVITSKEDSNFFDANNVEAANAYQVFAFYRIGGPPTNLFELGVLGPNNYGSASQNLTLVDLINVNGMTLRELWISVAWFGIHGWDQVNDTHARGITTEFCYGGSFNIDAGSEITIDFCNFWPSTNLPTQPGVVCAGRGVVTNSRFIYFRGVSFKAKSGVFANNFVAYNLVSGNALEIGDGGSAITGNEFRGGNTNAAAIAVAKNASITGNYFYDAGEHSLISGGTGAAGSATDITITGNTFVKTSANPISENNAIIAPQDGVSYVGAGSPSMLIVGNNFRGRALQAIAAATLRANVFDDAAGAEVVSNAVTFNGAVAHDGAVSNNGTVSNLGDVFGKTVMTGNVASGVPVNIAGVLGIGDGTIRGLSRLNLIAVIGTGTGLVEQGYALYTSWWNGNARLIATLGVSNSGGTLVFGTNGNNPTFTITGGDAAGIAYTVNAVPLI